MRFDTDHPFILTATCDSRMGTTAAVATFLASRRFYLMEMQQFDDTTSESFFLRVKFCSVAGETVDMERLRTEFMNIAAAEKMTWQMYDTSELPRVLIMVSKFDHCLEDLLYRKRIGELKMDVRAIVSNHPLLEPIANQHRIPYVYLPVTEATKVEQESKLLNLIDSSRAEIVILARYMQILSDELCAKLAGRAINIHHSFLPAFAGAEPYRHAYERGVKLIGATAHYATEDLDEGPIIEQDVMRVGHRYTIEDLERVGRDLERMVLARAVRSELDDRVLVHEGRTIVF